MGLIDGRYLSFAFGLMGLVLYIMILSCWGTCFGLFSKVEFPTEGKRVVFRCQCMLNMVMM